MECHTMEDSSVVGQIIIGISLDVYYWFHL